ncbi:hypothetical protein ET495_07220 [Xylanimonas allomyrinae]|uniref:Integral membrane bound transporter domain-containing protein n=1 Tax=Xylanimonas allomyrinae TaxID=2509459 RepID=A0A4P6ENY9_9MICO|nr:hypothetical protein ET495_07220 [Xylanimonas allomyrinae]
MAVAVCCGILLADGGRARAVGAGLFALAVAVPVWLRRFGAVWQAAGAATTLPLAAVLVVSAALEPSSSFLGWALVAAGVALAWTLAVRSLRPPATSARPTSARPTSQRSAPRRPARTPRASTRLAVQAGVAVAVAFAAAQWVDPAHVVWPVMTALIVHSANRGRGDVLWKGVQRVAGALAGTAVATLLGTTAGDRTALALLFAILALAAALRPHGHVFWAFGVTAALSLFYGFLGQAGPHLLQQRLLGVVLGGVVAVACAWIVLPVRTCDVTRSRVARLAAAAREVLAAAARGRRRRSPRSGSRQPTASWNCSTAPCGRPASSASAAPGGSPPWSTTPTPSHATCSPCRSGPARPRCGVAVRPWTPRPARWADVSPARRSSRRRRAGTPARAAPRRCGAPPRGRSGSPG